MNNHAKNIVKILIFAGLALIIPNCTPSVNEDETTFKSEVLFDRIIEYPNSSGGEAYTIKELADRSYIAAGRQYTAEGIKAFFLSLSEQGEVQWHKLYTGQSIYSFIETDNGGFIGTGSDNGEVIYVLRIDNIGNLLWEQRIEFPFADAGYKIVQTSDHNFVVAANSYATTSGSRIIKLNDMGKVLWTKEIQGKDRTITSSLFENTDGTMSLLGTTRKSTSDIYDTSWCARFDQQGNEIQRSIIPGSGYNLYNQWHESTVIKTGTNQLAATTFNSFYLMDTIGRIQSGGEVHPLAVDQGTIGYPSSARIYSAAKTTSGDYILCGAHSKIIAEKDTGNNTNIYSISHGALYLMNASGGSLGGLLIGDLSRAYDAAYSVLQAYDGSYVICGGVSISKNRYPLWVKKIKISK